MRLPIVCPTHRGGIRSNHLTEAKFVRSISGRLRRRSRVGPSGWTTTGREISDRLRNTSRCVYWAHPKKSFGDR